MQDVFDRSHIFMSTFYKCGSSQCFSQFVVLFVASRMKCQSRGVKRGGVEAPEPKPKVSRIEDCPRRLADAIVPVLRVKQNSFPHQARKILALEVIDNFELLRAVISCIPTKVPTIPFLYSTLHHARQTLGEEMSEIATKKDAGIVKALIQYVRHLWRNSSQSKIAELETLKGLCRPATTNPDRQADIKFVLKIDHSKNFDLVELVDLTYPDAEAFPFKMSDQQLALVPGLENCDGVPTAEAKNAQSEENGAEHGDLAALEDGAFPDATALREAKVKAALAELPERAAPKKDIKEQQSFQARPASCGSRMEVLLRKRAFRLRASCAGDLTGKTMQFAWGNDVAGAWAKATAEVCSCENVW